MPQNRDRQLIEAVRAKNISTVRELLAEGANPNLKDGDETLLEIAEYDREIRYALVEAGAWDNALRTEMVMALDYGVEVVKILIEKGADVNVQTFSGTPLSVAARKGDKEIVNLLIDAGADLDAETPLNCALENGHYDIAIQLLEAGAMPDSTSMLRSTPAIAIAASQGATQVIQALLKAGADANTSVSQIVVNQAQIQKQTTNALGEFFQSMEALGGMLDKFDGSESSANETLSFLEQLKSPSSSATLEPIRLADTSPLILAARFGHAKVLSLLLEFGANPQKKDGEGLSAYDWAIKNNHVEILKTLKTFGIEGTETSPDEELLNAAIAGNSLQVAEALAKGANIDVRDLRQKTKNKTSLMLAVEHEHLEVMLQLLQAGADPNLGDAIEPVPKWLLEHTDADGVTSMGCQLGRTALMFATQQGNLEFVRELIRGGAAPDVKDGLGYSALTIACELERLSIVQELLSSGADLHQRDPFGNTPLMIAVSNNQVEIVQYLIEAGSDVHTQNREGKTLLMEVAGQGNLSLVNLLLTKKVDVNLHNRENGTALIAAINHYGSTENLKVIEALLEAGADPNLGDYEKGNALTTSIYSGSIEAIAKLIEAGVDVGKRDREGRSALGLAKVYHRQNVLAFLRGVVGDRAAELEVDLEVEQEDDDERWGEEIEPPDFSERAATDEYQQAVRDLAEICGDKASAINELEGGFYINVRTNKRKEIDVEALQNDFLERDCFVFQSDRSIDNLPHRLWILPTTDKYEAIAAMGTNGCNCGIGTGYVLEWLRELEEEQPFVITSIRGDLLSGRFLTPIQDPEELAERMYEFCPDIVSQGCGSVENLADSLKNSDNLYFWWD
ncbi:MULTISPECIES: ankyrin repeat domain-containing protein [Pseudanabaena]|uniref:Ankyrin n=2 Tax=Pseudanabaena TaxID=1152 RepID=L8MWR7_9CYAN|nr:MULTISPECIES: ankyrin repeat domain-containing protein [Pseudanabaena]ELS32432.1 Ankyrin [Pseudanabaena biceps PCC 7429]MDG3495323.1 ankyrin repeat domain-containing protein [Pseudanabaena catenata USMAC16]